MSTARSVAKTSNGGSRNGGREEEEEEEEELLALLLLPPLVDGDEEGITPPARGSPAETPRCPPTASAAAWTR